MATLTQAHRWGDFLCDEAGGLRSREQVTIASSQTIVPGQVLGKVTANGRYVVLAPGASDGSEAAAAIALYPATTGGSDTKVIAVVMRDCVVNGGELTWPVGITTNQKTAATGQLTALGIIVRPGV